MLSTAYRLRLEGICKAIAAGTEVSIEDMIWAQKLSKRNTSARGMLSSARRLSITDDDSFLTLNEFIKASVVSDQYDIGLFSCVHRVNAC